MSNERKKESAKTKTTIKTANKKGSKPPPNAGTGIIKYFVQGSVRELGASTLRAFMQTEEGASSSVYLTMLVKAIMDFFDK